MNRRELEKYEQIRNIASRDWLSASSVSLTKLDQVKTSVYNIGSHVTDARTLRPRARSAKVCRRKKSYTEMDTEPPLSKLSIQTHAWGSNTSIPDLIRQQSERLQSGNRPTSATVSRRPWSAKKIPQSPSSRKPTSIDKAIPFNEYGPPIAILGERYNPRSRPPSGSTFCMSVQHHDVEAVTVANTHEDLNQMSKEHIENTLEEFVNSQPNANAHNLAKLSAAYADEETVSLPPPPPCGSPDIERMINGGTSNEETDDASKGKDTDREELRLDLNIGNDEKEESDDEDKDDDDDKENMSYKEINVKQSPRTLLLRRPTPEPMLFSIPTGEASDEDELDTDRLLKGGTGHDIEVESVDNYIYDDEPQNNDSKYTSIMLSSRSVDEATGTRPVTKATVRIAEDRNITVDITPRSPHSPRRKRMVSRRRPRSAVTSNETDVMAERQHAGVRTTHPAYRKRPVSAKARLATSTVSVDYGDADEKKEAIPDDDKAMENVPDDLTAKIRKAKRRKDVETMMSKISLSDTEEAADAIDRVEEAQSEQKSSIFGWQRSSDSSLKTNYYEVAMTKKQGLKSTDTAAQKFKTVKTIEFGDDLPKETKTVEALVSVPETPKVHEKSMEEGETEIQYGRSCVRRPQSAKTKLVSKPPFRQTSRMEQLADLAHPRIADQKSTVENHLDEWTEEKPSQMGALKLSVRPFSAPQRRPQSGKDGSRKSSKPFSPRRHIKSRPRSATTAMQSGEKCKRADRPVSGQSSKEVSTPSKLSYSEHKRNREAVKSLREGTLFKGKAVDQVVVAPDAIVMKPYLGKKKEVEKPKKPKQWVYETNEAMIMDDVDEEKFQNLHDSLHDKGVNVSVHTLKKGLMPPREKGYTECLAHLPANSTSTLLSHPEEWLGEVFQRYKLAEKALQKANNRMIEQEEMEAKLLAAAMEARSRKKKKVLKKRKHKRASTHTS